MRLWFAGACTALGLMAAPAQAALLHSYDFTTGLGDTMGTGPSLTSFGGVVSGGTYTFDLQEGLRLVNGLPSSTDYAIEIGITAVDSVSGYNKVLDFLGRSSDFGIYFYNAAVEAYGYGVNGGFVPDNVPFVFSVERSGNLFSAWVNGVLAMTTFDPSNIYASNDVHFFMDDSAVSGEALAGSLDYIRIHDTSASFGTEPTLPAVPLPASAVLLLAGLAGLGALRQR